MSNYVKATNFATKDTLPTGDSNKIVKGTEIDNEFNSIAGAISSKADLASPTFTGTPAAPTATAGSSTTQIATTAFVTAALQAVYPVGSIYINAASSSNPTSLLGFGTWTEFGAGRVLVGQNASDALFDTLEETGGSKDAVVVSHNHTASSSSSVSDPGHTHTVRTNLGAFGSKVGNNGDGSGPYDIGGAALSATTGISVSTSTSIGSTGSSGTNANVQPYIVVKMWKRTA
jgi:hypothetical protein